MQLDKDISNLSSKELKKLCSPLPFSLSKSLLKRAYRIKGILWKPRKLLHRCFVKIVYIGMYFREFFSLSFSTRSKEEYIIYIRIHSSRIRSKKRKRRDVSRRVVSHGRECASGQPNAAVEPDTTDRGVFECV